MTLPMASSYKKDTGYTHLCAGCGKRWHNEAPVFGERFLTIERCEKCGPYLDERKLETRRQASSRYYAKLRGEVNTQALLEREERRKENMRIRKAKTAEMKQKRGF